MTDLTFGWHLHSFPVDGSNATDFRSQLMATLDYAQNHFRSVWIDDHVMPWATWQSNDTPYIECLSTIAYLGARYPTIDIGASVLCQSYRNPALLAKTVANIQWLLEGRFIFGIGAGWMEPEYKSHNWEFPKPSVRIAQMVETIEIAKAMWTQAPASYEGKHYRIEEAYCEPRPDPIPPILIGGGGEELTLRAVAQHADMWNIPGHSIEQYRHKLDVLRGHCDKVDRDYDEIVKTWSCESIALAPTESEAKKIMETSPYDNNPVVGTPEMVAAYLQNYVDMGVTYIIVRLNDFPRMDGMQLFVEEVMPKLQSA